MERLGWSLHDRSKGAPAAAGVVPERDKGHAVTVLRSAEAREEAGSGESAGSIPLTTPAHEEAPAPRRNRR
ncbi:hypothetical protein [Streptomyces sp. NPDC090298]|uniref:hypothetical protein n=1 Tax=Streptomyces sp. NPDC090298 TaxID=3365959 RepID=UPI0037F342A5